MLFEHICKCFVGQFLNCRHPVASKLFELVECVVVEGDQFAQVSSAPGVERMLMQFAMTEIVPSGTRSGHWRFSPKEFSAEEKVFSRCRGDRASDVAGHVFRSKRQRPIGRQQ